MLYQKYRFEEKSVPQRRVRHTVLLMDTGILAQYPSAGKKNDGSRSPGGLSALSR